jgi:HEAT repeat protein
MNWLLPPLPLKFEAALRDVQAIKPESRMAAAERLGRAEGEELDPAIAGLTRLTRDTHAGVRATALAALGLVGGDDELDVIVAALSDDAPEVREFAMLAAAQIGGERAVSCLRRELTNGAPEVRFQAVAGVAELAPSEAAAWLVPLLDDRDAHVRGQVVSALASLDEAHLVGHLAGALDDEDGEVRLEAALALARFGDARAEEPLLEALVRRKRVGEVARALGKLRSERAREPMAALAAAWLAPPHLRAELGAALVELGDDRGTRALQRVLRGLRSDARGYAVELACEVQAVGVVPELVGLLRRPRGVDSLTVIEALGRFPSAAEAQATLQALAGRDDMLGEAAREALRGAERRAGA